MLGRRKKRGGVERSGGAPGIVVVGLVVMILRRTEASSSRNLTVQWHAPFFSGGGYCSEASTFVVALEEESGLELGIAQHGDGHSGAYVAGLKGTRTLASLERLERRRSRSLDVAICHSEPGAWHVLEGPAWPSSACPPRWPKPKISIGRTMFETDRLPDGWPRRLNAMDEIWVPTEFHADIFARAGVQRLFVLGEPVDVEAYSPDGPKFDIGVPEDAFVALSVFKWEARKGWDILLRAWRDAFSHEIHCAESYLVLLTNAYHSDSDFNAKLDAFARNDLAEPNGLSALCNVLVLSQLDHHDLVALYRRADVLAMPTRGEGWGRPHVEAMAAGTPVIATNWSGPTAFLTPANGYPLRIKPHLVPVGGDSPFREHLWADPDPSHLADLLRKARHHPDQRRAKGLQARADMVRLFSPHILAAQVRDRLTLLAARAADDRQHRRRRPDHDL